MCTHFNDQQFEQFLKKFKTITW